MLVQTHTIRSILTNTPNSFINDSPIYRVDLCLQRAMLTHVTDAHVYHRSATFLIDAFGIQKQNSWPTWSAQIRSGRSALFLSFPLRKMYCFLTKYLLILHKQTLALAKLRKTKLSKTLLGSLQKLCFSVRAFWIYFSFKSRLSLWKVKSLASVTFEEFKWGKNPNNP